VVTTTVSNAGVVPVFTVRARLAAPAGWRVRATSRRETPLLLGRDRTFTTAWAVTPPAGTPPGRYELPAEVTYRTVPGGAVTAPTAAYVVVPPPAPPAGTAFLSGLPWLQASNGWGPVEIDRSNGEQGAGDGNPITINGTVYARGLGVHAASSVAYFVGGRCSAVTASVGVDDEEGADGTVSFQIWADGRSVADSGVLTNAMAAAPISADVTGASAVTLVVTDGGDGVTSDHGDWADLQITCQ
jgi:alpha-galactosidase